MPAPSDILQFLRGQLFETPQLPNKSFAGQTIVVTGANTGLGFECAKHLAELDASVIVLGCRDISKGNVAKTAILNKCKDKTVVIHVWLLDMSNYESIVSFAHRMHSELSRLDALVTNAGISTNEYHVAEGLERTLTVNVTGTLLLSVLALPQLEETAARMKTWTRLTVVGSNVHCFADHRELQEQPEGKILVRLSDKGYANMAGRYFLSKLMVIECVRELARRMSEGHRTGTERWGVIVNCPSPGWCKTELFRQDDGGFVGRNMLRLIGRTAEVGARTLVSAIAAGEETHGEYLSECRVKRPSVFVRSEEGQRVQKRVWSEVLEAIANASPEELRDFR